MTALFKPLFSPNLLARRLTGFAPTVSPELTAIADQWSRTAADPAFLNLNEKPLQGQFLSDIFAHLLGFAPAVGHLEAYHLKPESASTELKGARTPDARLGFFGPEQDITRSNIKRGLDVLCPGGRLGFITSGTFSNANFAEPFRAWLPTAARFLRSVNFGENQPFADAEMVFPSISILEKNPVAAPDAPTFRAYFMRGSIPDSIADAVVTDGIECEASVLMRSEWRFQPAAINDLFDRIMACGRSLDEVVAGRIYRGVLTGLNEAFIIDQATRDHLVAADPACAPILRKMMRGEDLRPWYQQAEGNWLIFTRRGIDIEQYPSIKARLENFRTQLEPKPDDWRGVGPTGHRVTWQGRKAGSYKWYEIQDSVDYYPAFDQPKIFWPDIAKLPRFSLDEEGAYANNKGYLIIDPDPAVLAVLQSRVSWFCISQICTPLRLRGGLWQFQPFKQFVERLRIPDMSDDERTALSSAALAATVLARERYALHELVRHRLLTDFGSPDLKLNNRLTEWYTLDFATFRAELRKAFKAEIPVKERAEWEAALADWQHQHADLTARLIAIETDIDDRVYKLFNLTAADRLLLADHARHAMIDYSYGAV